MILSIDTILDQYNDQNESSWPEDISTLCSERSKILFSASSILQKTTENSLIYEKPFHAGQNSFQVCSGACSLDGTG